LRKTKTKKLHENKYIKSEWAKEIKNDVKCRKDDKSRDNMDFDEVLKKKHVTSSSNASKICLPRCELFSMSSDVGKISSKVTA
jgi:hypothetical protein